MDHLGEVHLLTLQRGDHTHGLERQLQSLNWDIWLLAKEHVRMSYKTKKILIKMVSKQIIVTQTALFLGRTWTSLILNFKQFISLSLTVCKTTSTPREKDSKGQTKICILGDLKESVDFFIYRSLLWEKSETLVNSKFCHGAPRWWKGRKPFDST